MNKLSFLVVLILVTGLFSGCSDKGDESVFYSIDNNNLQGLIENIADYPDVDLNNLEKKEYTQFRKNDGNAIAQALCGNADPAILKCLIQSGRVDVNNDDEYKYITEVMWKDYYEDIAELMIERGADINGEGESTLDSLIAYANPQIVDLEERIDFLLGHGAQADQKTVSAAMKNDCKYIYMNGFLDRIDGMKDYLQEYDEALYYAVAGNDKGLLECVSSGRNIKTETLIFAAINCGVDTLQKMNNMGCNFDVKDDDGWTPYIAAAALGSVGNDACINGSGTELDSASVGSMELSALDIAIAAGKEENSARLIENGCRITYQSWLCAVSRSDCRMAEFLLESGYEPSDNSICEAFCMASDEVADYLLNKGYSPDDKCEDGPAIDYVDSEERMLLFVKRGSRVTGDTLERAVELRAYEAVEEILEEPDIELTNALICATEIGDFKSIKLLLSKGADINEVYESGDYGYAAIHAAAWGTSSEILKYYIDNGGDLELKDSDGNTARELVKEYGTKNMKNLI